MSQFLRKGDTGGFGLSSGIGLTRESWSPETSAARSFVLRPSGVLAPRRGGF